MGEQKIAVVTGAGGAIGGAIARRLGNEGYTVACVDRDAESVERTSAGLPGGVHFVLDVSQETAVAGLRDTVLDSLGAPRLLVNAAGIFFLHDLLSVTGETFDQIIGVNLRGTFLTCKAFIPGFITAGGGAIVNVASTAGLHAGPNRPIYAASKAGVILLTRSIAVDYGPSGVRANCVCPGLIDTPMADWLRSDAEAFEKWEKHLPAQRIGTVEDIAGTVAFLASADATYMHGVAVVVDGGGLA
jgi:NAD(P)-dependent dehydrogenase (short-subunit alcohol dehydrogenase family)